jgi:hypothetical protein
MAMTFPLPVFRPDDRAAFRQRVGPRLAAIYDEWLASHKEQCDGALRKGDILARIEVDRDAWLAYCTAVGAAPDLENLLYFSKPGTG